MTLLSHLFRPSESTNERGGSQVTPFGVEPTPDQVPQRNPFVCVCGHSMGSHHETSNGGGYCSNGKMWCPCEHPKAVLEAQDLRDFYFRTSGWGNRHALTLGIHKSIRRGRKVTQLLESICWRCKQPCEQLIPTSFSEDLVILERPGPINSLLCQDCWAVFPVRAY
jgi:hypothetical protein